jgi:hypothetical protein
MAVKWAFGEPPLQLQVQSEHAATVPTFMATDQDDDEKKYLAGSRIDLTDFDSAF